MSRVAAIGDANLLAGYLLAGAEVHDEPTAGGCRDAWSALHDDVGLVILTGAARDALGDLIDERPDTLWVVTPA